MTGWHHKYWDTMEQLYWSPEKLGFRSIPRSKWGNEPDYIVLDRALVRPTAALYTRPDTASINLARMRRLEESLNHIFDITFGIAACSIIQQVFAEPLGFDDPGPFLRIGREAKARYPALSGNSTQHDALFVSQRSIIGVELKLGSKTSPGQVLKYLALMVAEELLSGRREQIGLLFITPDKDQQHTYDCANLTASAKLPPNFVASVAAKERNKFIDKMLDDHGDKFDELASRVVFAHLSWQEVYTSAQAIADRAAQTQLPDETLQRLMSGFAQAIVEHVGTNASAAAPKSGRSS